MSVEKLIASFPAERRADVEAVRKVVNASLPKGYVEEVGWKTMIVWSIPLAKFPNTYNKQPLAVVALASQKTGMSLHLMAMLDPAVDKAFRAAYAKSGKKLDMGKACLRFKHADDVALDVVAKSLAKTPPAKMIAWHEAVYAKGATARSTIRSSAKPKTRA